MNIGQIKDGIVLDHITAGNSMNIYNVLNLGKLDCTVALIKNAESLEVARKVDTIVLDKTGTLTEGHPVVTDSVWMDENVLWKQILYALEGMSDHPLAEAVLMFLKQRQFLFL